MAEMGLERPRAICWVYSLKYHRNEWVKYSYSEAFDLELLRRVCGLICFLRSPYGRVGTTEELGFARANVYPREVINAFETYKNIPRIDIFVY
jgi:hypothetical protein